MNDSTSWTIIPFNYSRCVLNDCEFVRGTCSYRRRDNIVLRHDCLCVWSRFYWHWIITLPEGLQVTKRGEQLEIPGHSKSDSYPRRYETGRWYLSRRLCRGGCFSPWSRSFLFQSGRRWSATLMSPPQQHGSRLKGVVTSSRCRTIFTAAHH